MSFRDRGDNKNRGSGEREKLSWREIDARRDQSSHRSSGGRQRSRTQSGRAATGYNRYKSELEAMFNKGSISDTLKGRLGDKLKAITDDGDSSATRARLIREINNAPGPGERNTALKEFLKAGFELPNNLELLTNVIDYPDERVVKDALEKIEELLESQKMARRASFIERLRLLTQTADDEDTAAVATRLIEKLRG